MAGGGCSWNAEAEPCQGVIQSRLVAVEKDEATPFPFTPLPFRLAIGPVVGQAGPCAEKSVAFSGWTATVYIQEPRRAFFLMVGRRCAIPLEGHACFLFYPDPTCGEGENYRGAVGSVD